MTGPLDPRLLRAAPALRRMIVALVLLQAGAALLLVLQAVTLADLIAAIFQRHADRATLLPQVVTLAAIGMARAALSGIQEWMTARASIRVRADLRGNVLRAVRRLGPAWSASQPTGRLVTAAGPGLESIDGYVTRAVPALIAACVIPAAVLLRIAFADWQSALVLLLTLPLVPVFMALIGITTRRHMQIQYATLARLSGQFLDLVAGLTTLRVYGQANRQVAAVRRASEAYRQHTMTTLRTALLSGLVLDLLATLSVAVVAVDIGLRLDHGSVTLNTALIVLLLAPELFAPLRAVGAQHHATEEGNAAATAAIEVIAEAEGAYDDRESRPAAPALTGTMTASGLTVAYASRAQLALDAVDLEIEAGAIVAVRGRSGAGKSTLFSCLLGMVAPASGRIVVGTTSGDADVASLELRSWREQLAWVPQRPRPTQDTVADEVALADPEATRRDIVDVLALCHAPHVDTSLGEQGSAISAGQLRRVALARALLRVRRQIASGAVPIVLLDEPSEDLDAATEQVVAAVVSGLAGRATVLIATHSDILAAVADRVIVLADGRVVDDRAQSPVRRTGEQRFAEPPLPSATPPVTPRRLRLLAGTSRSTLVAAMAISGAAGLAGLALTATSLWLICRAAQHPNVQALAIAVVGVRTFALARPLLRYAERLAGHDGALRLLAELRARVFAALAPLVPTAVDVRRGDLLRRFVTDVDGVQDALVRAVIPLAGALTTAIGAVALAATVSPAAAPILALGLAAALAVAPALGRTLGGPGDRAAAAAGRRDALVATMLDGHAELAAYGADGNAVNRINSLDASYGNASRRAHLGGAVSVAAAGAAAAASLAAVMLVGGAAIAHGEADAITIAVLVACVLAGFDALAPVPAALAAWSRFRAGLARVAEILARPLPVPEPTVAAVHTGPLGLVARRLSVAPASGLQPVVVDADFALPPGYRVALVGPSGCGKSTLLACALRLVPPDGGTMALGAMVNTTALVDLASADVPPLVAGSLQGDHVFDASLRDNLRLVRAAATDADLDEVASRAGLNDFIAGLPDGWSTRVGPDGSLLSGGQRQRLLLARALLANPRVLVLDEPTAHLDPDTEREVLADLLTGTIGRTLLLSTHRHLPHGAVDNVVDLGNDLSGRTGAGLPNLLATGAR